MNARTPLRTITLSGLAVTLLLTACGTADPGPTDPPSADPGASSAPAESPSDGLPQDPAQDQQQSTPPRPTPTRAVINAGPLEGEELNATAVTWFGSFCSGIGELSQFGIPDTQELSVEETAKAVGSTYLDFGQGFESAASGLVDLDDDMNFEKSDAFASLAIASLEEISAIYTAGSETVEAGTYATEEELVTEVNKVESAALEAGISDYGLSSLDQSVFEAVNVQVPACAGPES